MSDAFRRARSRTPARRGMWACLCVLLAATLVGAHAHAQAPGPGAGLQEFELTTGGRFTARLAALTPDTARFVRADGTPLVLPVALVAHGILDVPGRGSEWRPRYDQRQMWTIHALAEANGAPAEYAPDFFRAGVQVKLAALRRFGGRYVAGPFVGFAAFRAFYAENVAPVGVRGGVELGPRWAFYTDAGYGFPLATRANVLEAGGGMHLHPRLVFKGRHPFFRTNVEVGIGYVFQWASFRRFERGRYIGESLSNPAIPGVIGYYIPYQRLCFGLNLTFG